MSEASLLDSTTLQRYIDKGVVVKNIKIAIRYLPGAPLNKLGWLRLSPQVKPDTGGKILSKVSGGKHYVNYNAIYINEAFFRLGSSYPMRRRMGKSEFYSYPIAHYPGKDEEIIWWNVNGQLGGKIIKLITDIGADEENIHEFVFRLYKMGTRAPGLWGFDVYVRDIDFPIIPHIWTRDSIVESSTGMKRPFALPDAKTKLWKGWITPEMQDYVGFIKRCLLPTQIHAPDQDTYRYWFKDYCGMDEDQVEEALKFKAQVRLP